MLTTFCASQTKLKPLLIEPGKMNCGILPQVTHTVFSYHVMSEQANWAVRLYTNHYSSKCPMRHLLVIFVKHLNSEKENKRKQNKNKNKN